MKKKVKKKKKKAASPRTRRAGAPAQRERSAAAGAPRAKAKGKAGARARKKAPAKLRKPRPKRPSRRPRPAVAKAVARQAPVKLDRKMREHLRSVLEVKRQEILEAYQRTKQSSFEEGETYGTHDIGDMASSTYAREFFLTLGSSERELLLQIDAALECMAKHKYGVCKICRKRIAPARLVAIPWATLCVPCQTETEGR